MKRLFVWLWAIYLISYPIAVIGVAFDVRPGFSLAWAGSVLLFLQGALAALWLMLRLGLNGGGRLALLIALGAFVGETVGVATGFPFGPYRYTTILFPALPGSVPLPVLGAWLLVVITATAVAQFLLPVAETSQPVVRWARVALATLLGVALDLVLEPVAVHIEHYWVWHATGPYYGIPTANFLGWAVLCALLTLLVPFPLRFSPPPAAAAEQAWLSALPPSPLVARVAQRAIPISSRYPSPVVLYALTCAMFTIVDLTHGLWLATLIGATTLAMLAYRVRATYDK
jgi:putative membrane protein